MPYDDVLGALHASPRTWLVTGAAGFIGSNLVETLLRHGQIVVGLDNFATGFPHNLEDIHGQVGEEAWSRFTFHKDDIRDLEACRRACKGCNIVLQQAALGSVPRSIGNPIASHQANVDGFLNMLVAAKDEGVDRFVFASSSSVYGDHPDLPKVEERIGRPLSPYALTKAIGEQYAAVFAHTYGFKAVGLRYFNVFGRRQNPDGAYAAVIPKWISTLLRGGDCQINGDGETSRDFCYIANVVQANILAGTVQDEAALNQIYNVSFGGRTTLKSLFALIRDGLLQAGEGIQGQEPIYAPFREGDVRHSQADTSKIRSLLGYTPTHDIASGLSETLAWYINRLA
ncbi:NAD-dependent epimerase/dehydratase family protein [Geothrix oryzisoli]|uniref:NAD-dependent epimerase/dehydratase family protein n=1 Tax=Geothrix oryzisoli TaxID=2922721 RepID=UPI001FAD0F50|nr:NAD-dependent epimerase/dehydratase family protein [Geothrix oryzisoli]